MGCRSPAQTIACPDVVAVLNRRSAVNIQEACQQRRGIAHQFRKGVAQRCRRNLRMLDSDQALQSIEYRCSDPSWFTVSESFCHSCHRAARTAALRPPAVHAKYGDRFARPVLWATGNQSRTCSGHSAERVRHRGIQADLLRLPRSFLKLAPVAIPIAPVDVTDRGALGLLPFYLLNGWSLC